MYLEIFDEIQRRICYVIGPDTASCIQSLFPMLLGSSPVFDKYSELDKKRATKELK